jgi:hypothetical protein
MPQINEQAHQVPDDASKKATKEVKDYNDKNHPK